MPDQPVRRIQQQQTGQRRREEPAPQSTQPRSSSTYETQRSQLERLDQAIADLINPEAAYQPDETVAPQAQPGRRRRLTLDISDEELVRGIRQPGGE